MNKTIAIIVSIIAAVALAAAGMFFMQTQKVQKALNKAEKDLFFYKNTDLAKELEIVNLKLENKGTELANTQDDLKQSLTQINGLQGQISTLKANHQKINAYLVAIDAIETMVANGPSQEGLANADAKVAALRDSRVSDKWQQAKNGIDVVRRSWSGEPISDTVKTITLRIRDLVE